MQIKITNKEGKAAPSGKVGVIVSPNPKRERVFVDQYGNEIDPRTKQIIRKVNEEK